MFDALRAGIDEVAEADLDGVPAVVLSEMVEELHRMGARLEAAEARVIARWDAERAWQGDGAQSGAAWRSWKFREPRSVAAKLVRQARALRSLPEVAAAWSAGEIDRSHITALLSARTPRTEEAFGDGHKVLLDAARTQFFSSFQRVCRYWANHADPDGAEDRAASERAGREVHLAASFEGMFYGRVTLDPVSGEIVTGTLRIIEQELFEADWAEAKERLGREPMIFDLARTPAQRRADAMVEMAIRARTAPVGGRRPAPLFTIVAGYETFAGPICELWNRTVVTPGTAAAWLGQAEIERVVFDGPSRVVDVGARRRLFRGALRRAIEVRDRTCFHPTCDDPPERPQVDHKRESSKGGETTQENGRLGCGFHNRRRNTHPDDWGDDQADVVSPCDPDPPDG